MQLLAPVYWGLLVIGGGVPAAVEGHAHRTRDTRRVEKQEGKMSARRRRAG